MAKKNKIISLILLLALAIFILKPDVFRTFSIGDNLVAFPGAEGFGADSVGGRGGEVIEVTNLNDHGTGSLREAVESSGPRTIVFKMGGTITLEKPLYVRNSYITIAGQTAPGGGITLRRVEGNGAGILHLENGVHDVVVRYVRMRSGKGTAGAGDIIHIAKSERIIMDHVSLSWSNDELIGINCLDSECYNRDIGIQNSILSEALKGHSTGTLISGKIDYCLYENPIDATCNITEPVEYWRNVKDISYHHNLLAHNGWRNPLIKTQDVQFVNNVVYNWQTRVGSFSEVTKADYINNYFKMGPWTAPFYQQFILGYDDDAHDIWFILWSDNRLPAPSIYASGNILDKFGNISNPSQDNWFLFSRLSPGYNPDGTLASAGDFLPLSFKRENALSSPLAPISIQSASQSYVSVLADVGANKRLDCYGNLEDNIDSIDIKVISDVKNGDGPKVGDNPDHESFYGGFISVETGTPCTDTDKDGMPDVWEALMGLDITDSSDRNGDLDSDGYTNLEEYINGFAVSFQDPIDTNTTNINNTNGGDETNEDGFTLKNLLIFFGILIILIILARRIKR